MTDTTELLADMSHRDRVIRWKLAWKLALIDRYDLVRDAEEEYEEERRRTHNAS